MKSLVVDNFLPYPNIVRSWALSQEYFDSNQFSERYKITTSWPGIRTDHVMDMDLSYANVILSQVSMLAQNFSNKSRTLILKHLQSCCMGIDIFQSFSIHEHFHYIHFFIFKLLIKFNPYTLYLCAIIIANRHTVDNYIIYDF
jgi:hypothetical protein